jgi:hypothetical protein
VVRCVSDAHAPGGLAGPSQAFVGSNLLQSAFTRWCLMEKILEKLGVAGR